MRGIEKVYLYATVANSLLEYSYGYWDEYEDEDEDKDREGVFVLRERELRAYQHANSMKNT